jgi:hypothetical protein
MSVSVAALSSADAKLTVTAAVKIEKRAPDAAQPAEVVTDPNAATTDMKAEQGGQPRPETTTKDDVGGTVVANAEPATATPAKPWKVSLVIDQSLGEGAFVKDDFARTPYYGYAFDLKGTYEIVPKYLKVGLRFLGDQQLTVTNKDFGTRPREFQFRDIVMSASASELYLDQQYTGIKVTGGVDGYLPTSKLSRDQEMAFATRIRGGLSREFKDVGPGTLTLSYGIGLRYNFSPTNRELSADEAASKVGSCRSINRTETGNCLTSWANPRWSMGNDFSVGYDFLEKWSVSLGLQIVHSFSSRLNESKTNEVVAGQNGVPIEVGHSNFANPDQSNFSTLTVGSIELGYAVNDYVSLAFGLSTTQNPYIQSGSNSSALRFPWWDFSSESNNLSTFYLDLGLSY